MSGLAAYAKGHFPEISLHIGTKKILGKICIVRFLFYLRAVMGLKNQYIPVEPTKSELEILQVLWDKGPSTVREVNSELVKQREVNYTTTLKQMQIMADKKLLTRDQGQMKHVYSVAVEEQKLKAHLLDKFVDSMYKGSASKLVIQLIGNNNTSRQDLQEIKDMIKKLEG
jgi:BlaI family transcriptional regulator, penicillinase repressor